MNGKKWSDYALEQYLLGELDSQQSQALEADLALDSELSQRIDALRESNAQFQRQFHAAAQAHLIEHKYYQLREQRLRQKTKETPLWPPKWEYLAAAAVLVLMLGIGVWGDLRGDTPVAQVVAKLSAPASLSSSAELQPSADPVAQVGSAVQQIKNQVQELQKSVLPSTPEQVAMAENPTESAGIRAKGALNLELWQKSDDSATRVARGSLLTAGTILQIRLDVPVAGYVAVYSIDGGGVWTQHTEQVLHISKPGSVSLPTAYELDAAPKFEHFCVVWNEKSFAADSMLSALRQNSKITKSTQSLALPKSYQQSCMAVLK